MDNNLDAVNNNWDINVRFKALRVSAVSIIHCYSLSSSDSPFLPELFGCTSEINPTLPQVAPLVAFWFVLY
ncbi:hypothetical protein [Sphingobacterium sp. FBM7-1]|uniref:hypothetical protein n=1 Tax=Sphingobacterium sp. FBM7-1 TaxID=2886688 RepID=UPI001D11EA13|nr:hypothetical protein [Sphingobacterium sp. FBM7-1]MCC2598303.1 hypothetical protein [Sphingobacterium sp. FBM7-1]